MLSLALFWFCRIHCPCVCACVAHSSLDKHKRGINDNRRSSGLLWSRDGADTWPRPSPHLRNLKGDKEPLSRSPILGISLGSERWYPIEPRSHMDEIAPECHCHIHLFECFCICISTAPFRRCKLVYCRRDISDRERMFELDYGRLQGLRWKEK